MYQIHFTEKTKKQLGKLEKPVQERIEKVLERIRIRPHPHVSKLVGFNSYRLKIGDYRLLLDIDPLNLVILVTKIGHRKNIYDMNL